MSTAPVPDTARTEFGGLPVTRSLRLAYASSLIIALLTICRVAMHVLFGVSHATA